MKPAGMSMFRLIGAICLFLTVICCVRYPEDPEVIREDPSALISKRWRIEKVTQNGAADITATYPLRFFQFAENQVFSTEVKMFEISIPPFGRDTVRTVPGVGVWQFIDDEQEVDIIYDLVFEDPYNAGVSYREAAALRFSIQRLTASQLWLSNDSLRIELLN